MRAFLFGAALILLAGCTSARMAAIEAAGKSHHIKQFSGGKLIGEFDSVGMISNEPYSDGYYFQDRATHKLICVSGEVQITVND